MKYSKTEIRNQPPKASLAYGGKSEIRRACLLVLLLFCFNAASYSKEDSLSLKVPIQEDEPEENIPSQIDLSTVPYFPKPSSTGSGKRISTNTPIISLNMPLKLIVDNFIDTKTAKVGDYFRAHVLADFYIPVDPPQLIVPKGSWVRGRISFLKRPNFFIKSAKIGLHLDELVTPLSETLVLNTELDIQKGIISENGLLKPQEIKIENSQILPDSTISIPLSNLGVSLIDTLLVGKLYALLSQPDIVTINKGQELQIVLQRSVRFVGN